MAKTQSQRQPLALLLAVIPPLPEPMSINFREYYDPAADCLSFITMTRPERAHENAGHNPLAVWVTDNGRPITVWEREWNGGIPYLCEIPAGVERELVIAVMGEDNDLIDVIAIRDRLLDKERDTGAMLATKAATQKAMGAARFWRTRHEEQFEAHAVDLLAAKSTASVAPATESVIEVLTPTAAAAPVRAPQPAPAAKKEVAAPATPKPVDPVALARRAALTERPASTVYDIKSGAELVGIPVRTKEFNLLTVGTAYVELSNKGRPKAHFVCVRTEGCPYDEHTEVTDIAPARAAAEGTGAQPGMLH